MTKNFRSLGQQSAILFMIVTVINMGFSVYGRVLDPGGREVGENDGETDTGNPADDARFLRRLILAAEKAGPKLQGSVPKEQYPKSQKLYNKSLQKDLAPQVDTHRERFIADPALKSKEGRDLISKPGSHATSSEPDFKNAKNTRKKVVRRRRQIPSFPNSPFPFLHPGGVKGHHFPLHGFNTDIQSMEEIWRTRTRRFSLLNHKLTGQHLQILEDGSVTLSTENIFCILRFKPIDYENDKVILKIFAEVSQMYLAMGRNGRLYSTKNGNNPDTDFIHGFHVNFDSYLSRKHRRYVAMTSEGKPARSRKSSDSNPVPPRRTSHFLVLNVSTELKSELHEYGKTTATALSTTTPATPERSRSQPEDNDNQPSPTKSTIKDISSSGSSSPTQTQLTLLNSLTTTEHQNLQGVTTSPQVTHKKRKKRKCKRKEENCKKLKPKRKCKVRKSKKQRGRKGRISKKEQRRICKKKSGSKKKKRTRRSFYDNHNSEVISEPILRLYEYLRKAKNTLGDTPAFNLRDVT